MGKSELPAGLVRVQETWRQLGNEDPFWAILAAPGTSGGKWKLEDFFGTGDQHIDWVIRKAELVGASFKRRRALDFGCGVGRLTQAMCKHFEQCIGVDVAEPMVALAQRHNRHPDNCRYVHNPASDLSLFEKDSFDFLCTLLVLQHMAPQYSSRYIKEFVRVLAPSGLIVLQIPDSIRRAGESSHSTAITSSLPKDAFMADITSEASWLTVTPSQHVSVPIKLTNRSAYDWPALGAADGRCQIKLANHWRSHSGHLIKLDDARTTLPADLLSGCSVELNLVVKAPDKAGSYLLEIDVVQEMVSWFANKGSRTLLIPVTVEAISPAGSTEQAVSTPAACNSTASFSIEMHGIPKTEVTELLSSAGARLLHVEEDTFAGPEWLSYLYFVTK